MPGHYNNGRQRGAGVSRGSTRRTGMQGRMTNTRQRSSNGTIGTNGLAMGTTVTGGGPSSDNPITRTFYAPTSPRYYRPDGSMVRVGSELHQHAQGQIMTQHTMENDNSVIVTTTPPRGGTMVSSNRPTRRRESSTQMAMNSVRNRRPASQVRNTFETAGRTAAATNRTNMNTNRGSQAQMRTNMNRTTNRPATQTRQRTMTRQPAMRRGGSGGGGY